MCSVLFRWLFRLFRGLCGGRRPHNRRDDDVEQEERLLPGAAQSSTAASSTAAAAQPPEPAPQPQGHPTRLVVMRHGHRQDEEDPCWHQTARRPWDPPLSAKGKRQAADAAAGVVPLGVQLLVSSPFRRCLQTSAELVRELGLAQGQWLVDWQLSEICDPRVLFSDRADVRAEVQQAAISSWMWGGLSLQAALEKFISQDCKLSKVPIGPQPRPGSQPPHFPESLGQGLQRYHRALQDIARSFPGQTVLVVTHGECVRSAVTVAEPQSEVFEVKHTGYVVLEQQWRQQPAGKAAAWKLDCEPGETGVMWLEDD